jgi:hypothetical protein
MTRTLYSAGRIWTMDEAQPYVRQMVVEAGRILAVGTEAGAIPCDETVDLGHAVVLPGFIDAHAHFVQMGVQLMELDLRGAASLEEALARVRERVRAAEPGEWVIGNRWDESHWPERRYINRADLDAVAPNNPVALWRICGHLCVANAKALEIAQVPNGDAGMDVQAYVQPFVKPSPARLLEAVRAASAAALELGVTSVHEQGSDLRVLCAARPDCLKVKVTAGPPAAKLDALCKLGLPTGFGDRFVRLGAVKFFADGSLGAHDAALYEPYADDPSTLGQLYKPEALVEQLPTAHRHGLQVAVHAIGDRAIDVAVSALRQAIAADPDRPHRHRIEHCELPTSQALETMASLGLIASAQPNFIGEWALEGGMNHQRLGTERYRRTEPLGTLLRTGIRMAFGSDGMPMGPLYGIWSATQHVVPEERLSVEQSVRCYTTGSAYAGFEEDEKGQLTPGFAADFTVLSADPALVPVSQIPAIRVLKTFVDGRCAFDAP